MLPNSNSMFKTKLYNHLTFDGNKEICEKIFVKTLKNLQKISKKNSEHLVLSAVLFSAPSFKIYIFRRKKRKKTIIREVPYFMQNSKVQISFAIKLLLKSIKNKGFNMFENLAKEVLLGAKNISKSAEKKNLLNEFIVSKKNLLTYYKW